MAVTMHERICSFYARCTFKKTMRCIKQTYTHNIVQVLGDYFDKKGDFALNQHTIHHTEKMPLPRVCFFECRQCMHDFLGIFQCGRLIVSWTTTKNLAHIMPIYKQYFLQRDSLDGWSWNYKLVPLFLLPRLSSCINYTVDNFLLTKLII